MKNENAKFPQAHGKVQIADKKIGEILFFSRKTKMYKKNLAGYLTEM